MRAIASSVARNRQTVSVYARFDAYARDSERTRAYSLEKISVKVATRLDDETDIGSSERRAWRTKLERMIRRQRLRFQRGVLRRAQRVAREHPRRAPMTTARRVEYDPAASARPQCLVCSPRVRYVNEQTTTTTTTQVLSHMSYIICNNQTNA